MFSRNRLKLIGLFLSLLAGFFWMSVQWYSSQADFIVASNISYRLLSEKTSQHEAVLATLATLSSPPEPDTLLKGLQPAMPQLQALGRLDDTGWRGTLALPQTVKARWTREVPLLAVADGDASRYWLLAANGWGLLIDSRRLLTDNEWPNNLSRLRLDLPGSPQYLLQRPTTSVLTARRRRRTRRRARYRSR